MAVTLPRGIYWLLYTSPKASPATRSEETHQVIPGVRSGIPDTYTDKNNQVSHSLPDHPPQEPLESPPSSELTVLGHLCRSVQDFGCSSPRQTQSQTQTRLQKSQGTSRRQDLAKGDFRATGSWEGEAGKQPPTALFNTNDLKC